LLAALADPTRRRIVELLGESPRTASELHGSFPIADPAVSRHVRVLREAGVIVERPVPEDRRVRLYALEVQRLESLGAWIAQMSRMWRRQLDSFKDYVDERSTPSGTAGEAQRRAKPRQRNSRASASATRSKRRDRSSGA
jgi:DNA-binding transcriptional ArsR family regulator